MTEDLSCVVHIYSHRVCAHYSQMVSQNVVHIAYVLFVQHRGGSMQKLAEQKRLMTLSKTEQIYSHSQWHSRIQQQPLKNSCKAEGSMF